MKVLIDENLPVKLHLDFKKHQAFSVAFMNWQGKENGELIKVMLENEFDALITLDKNLQYQQNFAKYPIVVIVIHAAKTEYKFIQPLVEEVEITLSSITQVGIHVIHQNL